MARRHSTRNVVLTAPKALVGSPRGTSGGCVGGLRPLHASSSTSFSSRRRIVPYPRLYGSTHGQTHEGDHHDHQADQ